jgi:hypothetical protein
LASEDFSSNFVTVSMGAVVGDLGVVGRELVGGVFGAGQGAVGFFIEPGAE